MKKIFSFLTAILFVGSMWATDATLSFSSSSDAPSSGTSYNDSQSKSWTITHDSEYALIDNNAIHVGSSSKTCSYLKATSSDFSGLTVTKVVVRAKQNGSGSVDVKINGSAFGGDAQTLTNSYDNYEFSGNVAVTGDIVVNLSRSSASKKNFFLYSIIVTYSNASDPVLQSIEVSGTPTTTTYEEGNLFDVTGLVVTGTYDKGEPSAISQGITWKARTNSTSDDEVALSAYTLIAGQTALQVQATVGTVSSAWFDVSGLTVNEHVIVPGEYTVNLNATFFGTTSGASISSTATESQNDITFKIGTTSGTKPRTDESYVRFYSNNYLEISVPTGYVMKSISFAEPSSTGDQRWDGGVSANKGTYTASKKSWSGKESAVTFSFTDQNRIASVTITYEAGVPTAIDNTEAGVKAVKVLREGQIFILRGEKVYTVQGQLVK